MAGRKATRGKKMRLPRFKITMEGETGLDRVPTKSLFPAYDSPDIATERGMIAVG
jgi:hypothetical protein